MLLYPFKILTVPAKAILGFVGVFLASLVLSFLSFLVMSWSVAHIDGLELFKPVVGAFSVAGIVEVAVFLLGMYSGYNDD